jgi:heat shock protein beta
MRVLKWFILVALVALICVPAVRAHDDDDDDVGTVETSLKGAKVPLKTDDEVVNREEQAMSRDGYSVAEQKQMKEAAEKFAFQTEVNKMMSILINSLYSNKEIFLRELISNSSDALDKIRFLALTDSSLLGEGDQAKLDIKIKLDVENNTLQITDRGIGMTKAELVRNLGTLAQSGTKEFLQKFSEQGDPRTSNLIGQFGVGFYSVFLVADHVTVTSKHNDDDQYIWTSEADGSFTIVKDPHGNTLGRGTRITLHFKEDATEFLQVETIKSIAKKYSEFINFPIYLWASHTESKEVPVEEDVPVKEAEAEEVAVEEEEDLDDEEEDTPKTKTVTETIWDWELLNQTKPIWTRSAKDISEEEYDNFYKSISKDTEEPLRHIHFTAEGDAEFKSILYIPKTAPQNMFDPSKASHKGSVKLFVRRVFITDDFEGLIPNYLKFIRGVVDSDDLPLNVSREVLQQNKLLKQIEKKLVRKSIAMFQELANDEDKDLYKTFWTNYGTNVKLGVIEDSGNRSRLTKLLMFLSSKTGDYVTLDDYVSRMKEGQDQIFYLAGTSKDAVEKSPLLERVIKRGYEVLYMVDPIDEYALQHIPKYDSKYKLTNLGKEGVKLDDKDVEEEKKKIEEEYKPLVDYLKDTLSDKLEKVVVTDRLTTSPCALVSTSYGYTANMERIIKAQALGGKAGAQQAPYVPKKILEINPRHPILKELLRRVSADQDDETAKVTATVLYETAVLSSGYSIEDPSDFAGWIHKMMSLNLAIDPTEQVVDIPEPVEQETDTKVKVDSEKDEL